MFQDPKPNMSSEKLNFSKNILFVCNADFEHYILVGKKTSFYDKSDEYEKEIVKHLKKVKNSQVVFVRTNISDEADDIMETLYQFLDTKPDDLTLRKYGFLVTKTFDSLDEYLNFNLDYYHISDKNYQFLVDYGRTAKEEKQKALKITALKKSLYDYGRTAKEEKQKALKIIALKKSLYDYEDEDSYRDFGYSQNEFIEDGETTYFCTLTTAQYQKMLEYSKSVDKEGKIKDYPYKDLNSFFEQEGIELVQYDQSLSSTNSDILFRVVD